MILTMDQELCDALFEGLRRILHKGYINKGSFNRWLTKTRGYEYILGAEALNEMAALDQPGAHINRSAAYELKRRMRDTSEAFFARGAQFQRDLMIVHGFACEHDLNARLALVDEMVDTTGLDRHHVCSLQLAGTDVRSRLARLSDDGAEAVNDGWATRLRLEQLYDKRTAA